MNTAIPSVARRHLFRGSLLAAALVFAGGCGSKSPSAPSTGASPSFSPGPLASVAVYVGQVRLSDGVGGTVVLRPSALFSALAPTLLDIIRGPFEASLYAQGSSASGVLVLPTGVIDLTGTYSGGNFIVSGGGYALTAAVSGGSLSGSGSGPQGGLNVSAPDLPPVPVPPPSDASGVYRGTYSMTVPARWFSTNVASGAVVEDCRYSVVFSGTLTVQLQPGASGTYAARLLDDWMESDGPPGSCNPRLINTPDPYTEFGGVSVTPGGPQTTEAAVSAAALQFAWVATGPINNGGTSSRTGTLVGAVSGATVVARFTRTKAWSNPRGVGLSLFGRGGYQGSVDVVLTKQ